MSTLKRHRFAAAAWALTIWAAACGKESSNDACTRGNEGCVCYPNKTCNPGLECLSSLCVSREGTGGGSVAQAGNDDSGAGAGPDTGGSGAATSGAGAPSSEGGANRGGTGGRASGGAATQGGASAGGADGGAAPETGGTLSGGAGSGGKASGGALSGGAGGASSGGTGGTIAQGGSSGKGGTGGTAQGGASGGTAQGGASGAGGACASGGAASLFFDNFECGTAAWTPQVAGSFALVMDGSNTYQRGTLANSLALSSAGSTAWGNVRIEVRVKALSFGAASSSSYVALYGHFIDASNYHAIAWQGDGTVAMRERTNGGGSDSYNQNTILTSNTWYTLAIEFSGTTTRILVDGALISSSIGATAMTGRMALGTFNATARFDDVRVTALP